MLYDIEPIEFTLQTGNAKEEQTSKFVDKLEESRIIYNANQATLPRITESYILSSGFDKIRVKYNSKLIAKIH